MSKKIVFQRCYLQQCSNFFLKRDFIRGALLLGKGKHSDYKQSVTKSLSDLIIAKFRKQK